MSSSGSSSPIGVGSGTCSESKIHHTFPSVPSACHERFESWLTNPKGHLEAADSRRGNSGGICGELTSLALARSIPTPSLPTSSCLRRRTSPSSPTTPSATGVHPGPAPARQSATLASSISTARSSSGPNEDRPLVSAASGAASRVHPHGAAWQDLPEAGTARAASLDPGMGVSRPREDQSQASASSASDDEGSTNSTASSAPSPFSMALEITVRDSGGLFFTCDDATLPVDDTNLVVRAARLFCTALAASSPAPTFTSPNASRTACRARRRQQRRRGHPLRPEPALPDRALSSQPSSAMAAELGPDVPLFLISRLSCCIRGRGEVVEPVPFPARPPAAPHQAPLRCPGAWAGLTGSGVIPAKSPCITYATQDPPLGRRLQNDPSSAPVLTRNTSDPCDAQTLAPRPARSRRALFMSGSGATVFAVLRDPEAWRTRSATRLLAEYGPDLWCWLRRKLQG